MRNRGWLPPKHSHTAPVTVEFAPAGMVSRTIPKISDSTEDVAMQLLYWLWTSVDPSQFCSGQGGLKMFGQTELCEKENAGWVNFHFVCDFYGMISTYHPFFLRACRVSAALPLLRPLQFLNRVASLACWVAKGAGHCNGGGQVFLPFSIEVQASMLNIMWKSQITSQNSV